MPGQIITFYSYKGGTGRTMALANIACLLAEQQSANGEKGVLMIDWDLEAPGLHKYFSEYLYNTKESETTSPIPPNNNKKKKVKNSIGGLIGLFNELDEMISVKSKNKTDYDETIRPDRFLPTSETIAKQALEEINLNRFIDDLKIKGLSLIQAGKYGTTEIDKYGEMVNTFDWESLYNKSPHIFRVFAEFLSEQFSYVLIDSRTGVTDVSGICTNLLPEKLVIVFTPNIQSLEGGIELIKRATNYRRESADLRPLMVYPLVSRVASEEPKLRNTWRNGDVDRNIPGFQIEFEKVLSSVYNKEKISLNNYFDEVQIQHVPRYAYGEEIAVLIEKMDDRFSLRRSYETFLSKLIKTNVPWEYKKENEIKNHCFVIMPFGRRTDFRTDRMIDFDKIYFSVLRPTVEGLGFSCLRADEIVRSNVVDVPMYEELLTADLVIADISISDPNVFYELGIRHTLRPFGTLLISNNSNSASVPFDLHHIRTIPYDSNLSYDEVLRFQMTLKAFILSMNESVDSPVYNFLQRLLPPALSTPISKKIEPFKR